MIRYGTIGTNFIVDHFQEAAMENPSLYYAEIRRQPAASRQNMELKQPTQT